MEPSRSAETLSDQNFVDSFRVHARWQTPCVVREEDGLLMLAGCSDYPGAHRNGVVRVDPNLPADEVLQRARAFFGPRARGFTVIVRSQCDADLEAHLKAEGLMLRLDGPCMSIEAPLPEPTLADNVRIAHFDSLDEVRDMCTINSEAYPALGMPEAEVRAMFSAPAALLSPDIVGFVAYRDGVPVSTALTLLSGESAGIYWVGTARSGGRSGLATACTILATNAGFARGARVVTLQASPFGEPIYTRLGYQTYARTRWYVQRPPA